MHPVRKLSNSVVILMMIGVMLCTSCQRLRVRCPSPPTPNPDSEIQEAIQALGSEDEVVRQAAAEKLVSLGTDGVPALIQALESKDVRVRLAAAAIIGEIGR